MDVCNISISSSDWNSKWCQFYRWLGWFGIRNYIHCCNFFSVAAFTIHPGYTPITFAVLGSLLGFLLFNVHPARIFMGDTGSLALGGFVVSIGFMLQIPLYIVVVGMIYLIEVLSVILQVGCYKITHGKRILKMAPLHHHLELMGIPETQIVVAFCMITALLCILGMVV